MDRHHSPAEDKGSPGGVTASPENRYYARVSSRFRRLTVFTSFLLVLFVLVMLVGFGDSITYSNLRFLFRDIGDVISGESAGIAGTIRYDEDGNAAFAEYRSGLVVAGKSAVSYYRMSGREVFSDSFMCENPAVAASEKYFIVYDLGGNSFSVYSPLMRVYREELDYPILGISAADDGCFAVLTRSREYRSTVLLYNSRFEVIGSYSKDKYISCTVYNSTQERLYIAAFYAENGNYQTELSIYERGSDTPAMTETLDGCFPLSLSVFGDGGFVLFSDTAAYFFGSAGETLSAYAYPTGRLVSFTASGASAAVILSDNTIDRKNNAAVFDTAGNMLYNYSVAGDVTAAALDNDRLSLLSEEVYRYLTPSGEYSAALPGAGASAILLSGSTVFLCYKNQTVTLTAEIGG